MLLIAYFIAALCLISGPTFGDELVSAPESVATPSIGMELLPRGRPFRLALADPREIKMGLIFEGESRVTAEIGNYFSLFALRPVEQDDWNVHFGLEGAAYFGLSQRDHRFPLETTDGLFGVYCEGDRGPAQWQIRFTHVSAHFADGTDLPPIAYSREFATGKVGYLLDENFHLYASLSLLVNSIPTLSALTYQAGASYFLPWHFSKLTPFVATDLKWKNESNYNPSLSLMLGIALNNPPLAYRSFRFFYSYYTGADPRGQFYNRNFTAHSLGIEMQI